LDRDCGHLEVCCACSPVPATRFTAAMQSSKVQGTAPQDNEMARLFGHVSPLIESSEDLGSLAEQQFISTWQRRYSRLHFKPPQKLLITCCWSYSLPGVRAPCLNC
jgi:hypothetical protein